MSRKGRRRTEGLMFNETGSISAEMIVEAREENGIWPIRFEPPPNGEKGWAHFAVSLLGLDTEMTPAEQAVLAVLIDHANPKTGQCNPSVTRIAKGVKRHRRPVFRALAGLQAKGLTDNLAKNHNGARRRVGNAYQVTWVKLRETLDAYEQRIAKAKRLAGLSSDSMMSPPSDGDDGLTVSLHHRPCRLRHIAQISLPAFPNNLCHECSPRSLVRLGL